MPTQKVETSGCSRVLFQYYGKKQRRNPVRDKTRRKACPYRNRSPSYAKAADKERVAFCADMVQGENRRIKSQTAPHWYPARQPTAI